jgi:hypothetical protein
MADFNVTCPNDNFPLTLITIYPNSDPPTLLARCNLCGYTTNLGCYQADLPVSDSDFMPVNYPLSAAMSGNSQIVTVTTSDGGTII